MARMIDLLQHQLTVLRESVVERFASEEHRGYLASIVAERSDLAQHVRELKRQHGKLKTKLARLAAHASREPHLPKLSGDITELIETLDAHASLENELIACVAESTFEAHPDRANVRRLVSPRERAGESERPSVEPRRASTL
jgi:hypothetical protein